LGYDRFGSLKELIEELIRSQPCANDILLCGDVPRPEGVRLVPVSDADAVLMPVSSVLEKGAARLLVSDLESNRLAGFCALI
jgi:hypothetical protein